MYVCVRVARVGAGSGASSRVAGAGLFEAAPEELVSLARPQILQPLLFIILFLAPCGATDQVHPPLGGGADNAPAERKVRVTSPHPTLSWLYILHVSLAELSDLI